MTKAEEFYKQRSNSIMELWALSPKQIEYIALIMQEYAALHQPAVRRSVSVDIVDSDIATIEALHDLLLDAHGYSLDFIALKRARELTAKMYKSIH